MFKDYGWTPEVRRKIWNERIKPCLGELVIQMPDLKIVRLVGLAEDKQDFFYIYNIPYKGLVFSSCVGGHIKLKGFIDDESYERDDKIFELNVPYWKYAKAERRIINLKDLKEIDLDVNVFLTEEDLP